LRIAFDQQIFLLQEYGGISRYVCALAESLAKFDNVDSRIFASLHINKNLYCSRVKKNNNLYLSSGHFVKNKIVQYLGPRLSRLAIRQFMPEIIHETYYSTEPFKVKKAHNVLTIHDMIHELCPQDFQNSFKTSGPKKLACQRADHIICVSDNTRRELVNIFGVSPRNISVIHHGVDHEFWGGTNEIANHQVDLVRPYLLFVGKRDGYKNFIFFLEAFASSKALMNEFDLVCFGSSTFTPTELRVARRLGLRSSQLRHELGSDSVLRRLYQRAAGLVYPSLHEGFGMPPLEAMAARCPVIVSNQSCLPEIVGDAGSFFDPLDIESARRAIECVVSSNKTSTELIKRGTERCKSFTWDKCAFEHAGVYTSLL
jgi:glycosyltransferase involved in cell wall biosynthesis